MHATVHATDPASLAVEQTRRVVASEGLDSRLSVEVQPTVDAPCSAHLPPFDAALVTFTLSAIPGEGDAALLAATAAAVRPGGAVLIRDYGMYDLRHVGDAKSAAPLGGRADHFLRPGGMHRRYYSVERIEELAAHANLRVEENHYLCVRLRNEARDLSMERVYVHAVLRRGEEVPTGAAS